jgi:hypothetical protein
MFSCKAQQKQQLSNYLSSGIENIKIFPANKHDSIRIQEINLSTEKALEKCKKDKTLSCIDDRDIMILHAGFPEGISNFRTILFNRFKVPKNAAIGENRILVTIGIKNNLENIEVLKYTDKKTKRAIKNVFKLKELNTWKSAKIYGIPAKEKFEISIFIANRKDKTN